jgi:hypothetical protein
MCMIEWRKQGGVGGEFRDFRKIYK